MQGAGQQPNRSHPRSPSPPRVGDDSGDDLQPLSVLTIIVGVGIMGEALALAYGTAQQFGIGLLALTLGTLLWLMGLATHAPPSVDWWRAPRVFTWFMALAFTAESIVQAAAPSLSGGINGVTLLPVAACLVLLSFAPEVARYWQAPHWIVRVREWSLLAFALAFGILMLRNDPVPDIDVWNLHQQAAAALFQGTSPYSRGAVAVVDGYLGTRTFVQYTYPPTALILTSLAWRLTGDSRFAMLIALVAAAALLAALVRRRVGAADPLPALFAACLLFFPRGWSVVAYSWVEPLALPFLGLALLCLQRGKNRGAAALLGLFCSVKQPLIVVLLFLCFPAGIGLVGATIAVGAWAATVAPFAFSPGASLWSALVVQHLSTGVRPDSVSWPAAALRYGVHTPKYLGFVAMLAPVLVASRVRRAMPSFLLLSLVGLNLLFLFGEQAFCNYYYLAAACGLFAAAISLPHAGDLAARSGAPAPLRTRPDPHEVAAR